MTLTLFASPARFPRFFWPGGVLLHKLPKSFIGFKKEFADFWTVFIGGFHLSLDRS